MTLSYRAVVSALSSLRGEPGIADVAPTHAAVRYRGRRTWREIDALADIYVPDRATGASALLVHGGGFVIGSRRMKPMRYLAAQLSAAGVAVCAIDYRMIFRGGRLAEATTDVLDALEFWSAHSATLGLDPAAVSLVGLSAGATLAWLAAARVERVPLAALVCCFGLYDVDHLRGPAQLLPRLLVGSADRDRWAAQLAAQPTVPTLLLHGADDGLVPVEQARRLAAHRDALGLPTKLVIYPDTPHGFFNLPIPEAARGARDIAEHVLAAARFTAT